MKTGKPKDRPPPARSETSRRRIMEALMAGEADSRELSALVGLPQKEVVYHLEHIQKSLHRGEYRFEVTPAECRNCGFVFRKRERLEKPGKCPVCQKQFIREPRFSIAGPGKA